MRTCVKCRGVVLALAQVEGTLAVYFPHARCVLARAGINLAPWGIIGICRARTACSIMEENLSGICGF